MVNLEQWSSVMIVINGLVSVRSCLYIRPRQLIVVGTASVHGAVNL